MRYFQPKSMTWWAGLVSILLGAALATGADHQAFGTAAEVLAAFTGGDASPAMLIVTGLGLIGIRDKLERG